MDDAHATEFSVAMTASTDRPSAPSGQGPSPGGPHVRDWRPSTGRRRTTAVMSRLLLPYEDERILQGTSPSRPIMRGAPSPTTARGASPWSTATLAPAGRG